MWKSPTSVSTILDYCDRPYKKGGWQSDFSDAPGFRTCSKEKSDCHSPRYEGGVCKRGICLAETTGSYEFGMSSELSMHSEWNIAIPLLC